ncbi:MAG TPA: hypothetical protein DCW90_09430 [Lachnospiraceae bacterium]|nr:hypothetical protein [Lachnospiraceae bacterium]
MNESQNAVEALRALDGKLVALKYTNTWLKTEEFSKEIRTKFHFVETKSEVGCTIGRYDLLLEKETLKHEVRSREIYFYASTYPYKTEWIIREI